MNFYNIKNRLRIASGLGILLISIVLTNLWEKQVFQSVDRNFASLYDDRLVPAAEIFRITDLLYEKRLLLQASFLQSGQDEINQAEQDAFAGANNTIDTLIKAYQETYLVQSESQSLKELILLWSQYKVLENQMLYLLQQGQVKKAAGLYNMNGEEKLQEITLHLRKLCSIQTQVGENLVTASASSIHHVRLVSVLEQVLAIIIALVCYSVIFSAQIVNRPEQKYRLN